MKEECRGCYLIRTMLYNRMFEPIKPEQITCQIEDSGCPCQECLVKITCNPIEGGACEKFIELNVKYRKEKES